MIYRRQRWVPIVASLLTTWVGLRPVPCEAQFSAPEEAELSVMEGWHETLCTESISVQQMSLANAMAAGFATPSADAYTLAGAGGLDTGYVRSSNAMLSFMVPGEAVWTESLAGGSLREEVRLGLPVGVSRVKRRVSWAAGPFGVDVSSIGLVTLYSDLTGPGSTQLPDDGLLSGVFFNTALMLQLTDSAYLYVRATLYYLFTENRFGFYLGSGDVSMAKLSYTTRLRSWEIKFEDRLGVYTPLREALDDIEVDEIAVAGRYRLGRFDVGTANPFSDKEIYFTNSAGVTASNWLNRDWKVRLHAERWDAWRSNSFEHVSKVNRLGGAVFYENEQLWMMPWATYDWYDFNDGQIIAQHAVIGATLPFSRTVQAYAKGSWTTVEFNEGRTFERPGWEVGAVHRITSAWSESLFGGNTFFINEIGDPFLGTYWRYTMSYAPKGSRFSSSAYVGQVANDLASLNSTTVGARLETRIAPRTRVTVAGVHSDSDTDSDSRQTDFVRVSLNHQFAPSISSTLSWQWSERESTTMRSDYVERLIMLSVQWNL